MNGQVTMQWTSLPTLKAAAQRSAHAARNLPNFNTDHWQSARSSCVYWHIHNGVHSLSHLCFSSLSCEQHISCCETKQRTLVEMKHSRGASGAFHSAFNESSSCQRALWRLAGASAATCTEDMIRHVPLLLTESPTFKLKATHIQQLWEDRKVRGIKKKKKRSRGPWWPAVGSN